VGEKSLPQVLTTAIRGSFPQKTILQRKPRIINQVMVDNAYTTEIIDRLMLFKKEIVDNYRIQPLTEDTVDVQGWNDLWRKYKNKSWLELPWYFAETFFYRRLLEIIKYFQPGVFLSKDPFQKSKRKEIENSMETLSYTIDSIREIEDLKISFEQRIHASLWGNRLDLSNFTVKNDIKHKQAIIERENILINDFLRVYYRLTKDSVSNIAFFNDNIGMELEFDLLLADFLLENKWVDKVTFYLKPYPFFVSDAMIKDVLETVQVFNHGSYGNLNLLGKRIQTALNSGKLLISTDLFWASSCHFCEIPRFLLEELTMYDLIILKGDVNYRRLLSDRNWPYTTSIKEIVEYFPTSFVILRTLKSPIIVNLNKRQVVKVKNADIDWLINGKRGIIQYVDKL
jgi:uncharacterized protein with ATP-grasp and redox domains